MVTGLGGNSSRRRSPAPPGLSPGLFVALGACCSRSVLAPFLAILIGFGEEFGWRGYLQSELFNHGPGARRGAAGRDLGRLALAAHPDGLQLPGAPAGSACC